MKGASRDHRSTTYIRESCGEDVCECAERDIKRKRYESRSDGVLKKRETGYREKKEIVRESCEFEERDHLL